MQNSEDHGNEVKDINHRMGLMDPYTTVPIVPLRWMGSDGIECTGNNSLLAPWESM